MDFMKDLENNEKIETENGAIGYKTAGSKLVDLNFAVPSFRRELADTHLFDASLFEDKALTLKWLLFLRDIKQGLGERKSFREFLVHLCDEYEELGYNFVDNVAIEDFGRWDDYIYLYLNTTNEKVKDLISFYLNSTLCQDLMCASQNKPVTLLAKWLPSINASSRKTREDAKTLCRKMFKLTPRQYRKSLSTLRKRCASTEVLTSANNWDEIDYSTVPSKANLKYASAFYRHDFERRAEYLEKLKNGEVKINCDSMFLYDIVHKYGRQLWGLKVKVDDTLEALWNNQKSIELTGDVLVVRDGSASMTCTVSNSVSAMEISDSICLYCAEHNEGAFKNKFITFSRRPKVVDLTSCKTLAEKLNLLGEYDDCSNTDLKKTFKLILDTAVKGGYKQEDIPKTVLIVSD